MCCRFRFGLDEDDMTEYEKMEKLFATKYPSNSFPKGDIFPTDECVTLIKGKDKADIELMKFGYVFDNKKGVLLNAKSETIFEKYTFKKDIYKHRCVIMINGFYEWDNNKNKYYFSNPIKGKPLYLAGIYQISNELNHFAIITEKANECIDLIHDRMPLILKQEEVLLYLNDDNNLKRLLNKDGEKISSIRCE